MNLVFDVGNTFIKYAVFHNRKIIFRDTIKLLSQDIIEDCKRKYSVDSVIISSVKDIPNIKTSLKTIYLSHKLDLPVEFKYKTLERLGNDRIASVVGASMLFPDKDVLVIDAGSCITIDFIDKKKTYHGGRISPGIEMRYKSLDKFTNSLPKLTLNFEFNFIGNDTSSSIISGVQNGVLSEIDDIIFNFRKENPDLFVIVTGGDTIFFEKGLKSKIFADQFFVLRGLNEILEYYDDTIY